MKIGVLLFCTFFIANCYSQKLITSPEPDWINAGPQVIHLLRIKTDSVYLYKKKKNNRDSILTATQYFDSIGNLVERDVFNDKGEVIEINNYIYVDTMLMRQETTSKTPYSINGVTVWRQLKTYDYDTLGNVVAEKNYSYRGDSLKPSSDEIWTGIMIVLGIWWKNT